MPWGTPHIRGLSVQEETTKDTKKYSRVKEKTGLREKEESDQLCQILLMK